MRAEKRQPVMHRHATVEREQPEPLLKVESRARLALDVVQPLQLSRELRAAAVNAWVELAEALEPLGGGHDFANAKLARFRFNRTNIPNRVLELFHRWAKY